MGSKNSLRPSRTFASLRGFSFGINRSESRPSGTDCQARFGARVSRGNGTGSATATKTRKANDGHQMFISFAAYRNGMTHFCDFAYSPIPAARTQEICPNSERAYMRTPFSVRSTSVLDKILSQNHYESK